MLRQTSSYRVTLILYQNIVPISLYITIEIVKSVAVSVETKNAAYCQINVLMMTCGLL